MRNKFESSGQVHGPCLYHVIRFEPYSLIMTCANKYQLSTNTLISNHPGGVENIERESLMEHKNHNIAKRLGRADLDTHERVRCKLWRRRADTLAPHRNKSILFNFKLLTLSGFASSTSIPSAIKYIVLYKTLYVELYSGCCFATRTIWKCKTIFYLCRTQSHKNVSHSLCIHSSHYSDNYVNMNCCLRLNILRWADEQRHSNNERFHCVRGCDTKEWTAKMHDLRRVDAVRNGMQVKRVNGSNVQVSNENASQLIDMSLSEVLHALRRHRTV